MDPLHLFPVEQWSKLEEAFKADWPRGVSGFIVLDRQKYILQCGLDYGFKVYCPFGDVSNGMVAVNIKKTFYEVIIQCPSDDTSKLEEALKTTNIIDWTREIEVPFAPQNVISCIERLIQEKRLVMLQIIPCIVYMLDRVSPLFNVKLPPGFTFDFLTLEYVNLLDSTWPHRYPNSNFYFELQIKAKLGHGLFKDGKLVAWALVKEVGALSHLYTIKEERRKGYGELVLKLISNVLIKDGKYVVAYCAEGNVSACKLYQKLNFQPVHNAAYCTVTGKK